MRRRLRKFRLAVSATRLVFMYHRTLGLYVLKGHDFSRAADGLE
jgi:hypothetical protein